MKEELQMSTGIEWTDETWNPVTGCTKVSPGCDRCYAESIARRFAGSKAFPHGFDVTLHPDRLDQPRRWRKPRRVFVNSMSDLFHQDVPDEYVLRVWQVMADTPQHTYQVLTKRHGRLRSFLRRLAFRTPTTEERHAGIRGRRAYLFDSPGSNQRLGPVVPLDNVWIGVSVEDQERAALRIPALMDAPAAVRFVSCEPLLGELDLRSWLESGLTWVICGGESGPQARPMHPEWARSLRDQCQATDVPFFFKQWGEWAPAGVGIGMAQHNVGREALVGPRLDDMGQRQVMRRVGKGKAGRELDGRTWEEFPDTAQITEVST
jgi:protein gp37